MNTEDAVREEVSDRLGRELPDKFFREMYGRAQEKLRHIVTHFGDAGGARNTVEYIAQLTIEAIQAEALTRWTAETCRERQRAKNEEAGTMTDPQGHTNIILQAAPRSQAIFA